MREPNPRTKFSSKISFLISGEYDERDHIGRSAGQIAMYRSNMSFLNRVKPAHLRPKKKLTEEEAAKWLPREDNGRSKAQNECFIANKQRLTALRKCSIILFLLENIDFPNEYQFLSVFDW
jgi:hypothetical protein